MPLVPCSMIARLGKKFTKDKKTTQNITEDVGKDVSQDTSTNVVRDIARDVSMASRVWNVLELRLMILQFVFASRTIILHDLKVCKTPKRGRPNKRLLAILCINREVFQLAHPVFLACSTFQPTYCFFQGQAKYGLPYKFGPVLSKFLSLIKYFEVSISDAEGLLRRLRDIGPSKTGAILRLNESSDTLVRSGKP